MAFDSGGFAWVFFALILKDMSQDGEEESLFTIVSDDEELEAVSGVFANMLDDVEFVQDED